MTLTFVLGLLALAWPSAGAAQTNKIGPPAYVTATATDTTSITLSWRPPKQQGGGVTGYEVQSKRSDEDYAPVSPPHSGTETEYVHWGLPSGTTVTYRVRAVTASGTGPWSAKAEARHGACHRNPRTFPRRRRGPTASTCRGPPLERLVTDRAVRRHEWPAAATARTMPTSAPSVTRHACRVPSAATNSVSSGYVERIAALEVLLGREHRRRLPPAVERHADRAGVLPRRLQQAARRLGVAELERLVALAAEPRRRRRPGPRFGARAQGEPAAEGECRGFGAQPRLM